ncbi:MAG: fibronectin type III domain-containing protein, partial [Bacteroidales bacterium]|nr:fibronectin type III domain-containing protein [Bacteroidales bacterium]
TVTGLTNGTAYTFTVTATNAIGMGAASAASNSVTPATPPDAPTIGTVTAGNGQASVPFTAPASDGGSTITSYTATSSPGSITGTLNQAGSGTITVTGLSNGTAYIFTVTATNAIGTGAASAVSNSVTSRSIGDYYQGGVIFYLDGSGGGLICAVSDQDGGSGIQWYNGSYIFTEAAGTTIGTGQANTTAIITIQGAGSYAAKVCDNYIVGGYSDWFLPSKDELNEMYLNYAAINATATANGGVAFFNTNYWSSSDYDTNNAYGQYIVSGQQYIPGKWTPGKVRAVRAF